MRSQAVAQLKEANDSPYPHKFHVSISLTDFIDKYNDSIQAGEQHEDVVSVAGKDLNSLRHTYKNTLQSMALLLLLLLHMQVTSRNKVNLQQPTFNNT